MSALDADLERDSMLGIFVAKERRSDTDGGVRREAARRLGSIDWSMSGG